MKNLPRILPLVGVAAAGVLAVNALSGAKSLPDMMSGAKAFAEGAVGKAPADKPAAEAAKPADKPAPAAPPKPLACGPDAAALAKEAGLSPAELNILQSLRARSGQLDKRESDMDVQLQLMAAAEAKLDAKIKTLNGLKGEMQGLLNQTDGKQAEENNRLVAVYAAMKPKDAAVRMAMLDDTVRLPIASQMKERALSMVLANMAPAEAKKLTESLAKRYAESDAVAKGKAALAPQADAAAQAPAAQPAKASAAAKPRKG